MEISTVRDEQGVQVPPPFSRSIKVLVAPDRCDVGELTFSVVTIAPGSQTDLHVHDRGELIYVVAGHGVCRCGSDEAAVAEGTALFIRAGEFHQLRSSEEEGLHLVTAFAPGYTAAEIYERTMSAAAAAAAAAAG